MTTKPTALDAYMENQAAALALVERIQAAIANHDTAPAPEEIHWGHVGDMAETVKGPRAVSDRMFAEGEYGPEAE